MKFHRLINSMKKMPFQNASNCSARQEIIHPSWNLKFRYLHKSLPLVSPLNHTNPRHTLKSNFLQSSNLYLGLLSGLFPSDLLKKTLRFPRIHYVSHSSRSLWSNHSNNVQYRAQSSSLYSSVLRQHQSVSFPQCDRPSLTHIQKNSWTDSFTHLNYYDFR